MKCFSLVIFSFRVNSNYRNLNYNTSLYFLMKNPANINENIKIISILLNILKIIFNVIIYNINYFNLNFYISLIYFLFNI
jgi:hypothetical protein